MNEKTFLYDTYALLEILNASQAYKAYTECKAVINDFIFAEFCYKLFSEKVLDAEDYINEIVPSIIHASPKVVKEAMKFRIANKKKNLSMTDCISYLMAKALGIKFLTGDKEFKQMENVEFVK